MSFVFSCLFYCCCCCCCSECALLLSFFLKVLVWIAHFNGNCHYFTIDLFSHQTQLATILLTILFYYTIINLFLSLCTAAIKKIQAILCLLLSRTLCVCVCISLDSIMFRAVYNIYTHINWTSNSLWIFQFVSFFYLLFYVGHWCHEQKKTTQITKPPDQFNERTVIAYGKFKLLFDLFSLVLIEMATKKSDNNVKQYIKK